MLLRLPFPETTHYDSHNGWPSGNGFNEAQWVTPNSEKGIASWRDDLYDCTPNAKLRSGEKFVPRRSRKKSRPKDALQRELKRLSRRVEQGFRRLISGQQKLENQQRKQGKRLANLEKRQVNLEKRQVNLGKRQVNLGKRQLSLEKRQISLEKRQVSLEKRQISLEKRQVSLEKRQISLEKGQISLEKGQQKLEQRQRELEKSQKSLLARMSQVEAVLKELRDRQDRLEAKVDLYWERTVELINRVYNVVEKEREENMQFREQIYTMVDHVSRYFTDFEVEKKALAARDDRLESRIDVLEGSEAKQNRTLEELDTRVAALEARSQS
ncbi:MAG: hypothetical protein ONB48_10040 [candidate division KSB1 bacterium]|nr:hypothetical protein [candidate division KSB1 bacterium]MDZ7273827.1 hypothetical protein [candidate division KSB1 bacterium]MDZ7285983.1 hypothetical protein [candidate division KSB1 bacterium]MDZ7299015.1 hypothetical protein [candidate division KSB1 bacterium]MDZ7307984.1 hypothetical protein [candidate division KSB1 bacterium]